MQRARPGSHSFPFTRTADEMGIYPETIVPSFSFTRTPSVWLLCPVSHEALDDRVRICAHESDSPKQVFSSGFYDPMFPSMESSPVLLEQE